MRFSISLQLAFSHSSFASSHFFFIILFAVLYSLLSLSLIVCLFLIRFNISSVIHLFSLLLGILGIISNADSTSESLKLFHAVVSSFRDRTSNLFLTSIM